MIEKNRVVILFIFVLFLLTGCSHSFQVDDNQEEMEQESGNLDDDRCENFIENFSQEYPDFELLDYELGSEENYPIQLVAVAENKETGSSSTLFILDNKGTGQVVLASECFGTYRKEDGLYLDKNIISVSLDLVMPDSTFEIHDFNITVTKEYHQGAFNIVYASKETIRQYE